MGTYRAHAWSLLADNDMPAVGSLPNLVALSAEYQATFNILQEVKIALLMVLLNGSNHFKEGGNLVETFLTGFFGETNIHLGPLVMLAGGSILEVGGGIMDLPAFL